MLMEHLLRYRGIGVLFASALLPTATGAAHRERPSLLSWEPTNLVAIDLQRAGRRARGMANSRDRSWIVFIVLGVAGAFGLLGLCFVVAPRTGAAMFGIRVESGPAAAYVRAIGFRDL